MRVSTKMTVRGLIAGLAMIGLAACEVVPEPFDEAAISARATSELGVVRAHYYEPEGPLTLAEAIAVALKENLDQRVKDVEKETTEAELQVEQFGMYPQLSPRAEFSKTDVEVSRDEDLARRNASFGLTWNILDFGVSYARSKQSADRVLIAETRRRKAAQDIVREVQVLFWTVVGAKQLAPRIEIALLDIDQVMLRSQELQEISAESEPNAIAYRRNLLVTSRELIRLEQQLDKATLELGALLNLRPGAPFELVPPDDAGILPIVDRPLADLELLALTNRPELQEEDYLERISQWEAREALLSMLPGISLDGSAVYDSDSLLVNNNWIDMGLQVSSNLLDLITGPARAEAADKRGEVARAGRLATSAAVIAQVHVSYHELLHHSAQFRIASQISQADDRLGDLALLRYELEDAGMLLTVEAEARHLLSIKRAQDTYAELRRAHSQLMHTVGLDFADMNTDFGTAEEVAAEVQRRMNQWATYNGAEPPSQGHRRVASLDDRPITQVASIPPLAPQYVERPLIRTVASDPLPMTAIQEVEASDLAAVAPAAGSPPDATVEHATAVEVPVRARAYYLQVAVVHDEARAHSHLDRLQQEHRAFLGSLGQRLVKITSGAYEGAHRSQLGPVDDLTSAQAICRTLRLLDTECLVTQ